MTTTGLSEVKVQCYMAIRGKTVKVRDRHYCKLQGPRLMPDKGRGSGQAAYTSVSQRQALIGRCSRPRTTFLWAHSGR